MLVVKVGGGDLDLSAIARDLASLDRPFVLLHGANRLRDELATALGRPPQVIESMSGFTSVLTDDDAIDVLMAAYSGIRNKRLVEALRKEGVNALGLSGLDGGLVTGERTRGIRVERDGRRLLLRDESGKPRAVNTTLLHDLLASGYAPVITVPIAGEDGSALNTENDDVLSLIAAELNATEVVSLIEAPGLLADRDDPTSLVASVHAEDLPAWEGRVEGRMRRKIKALRSLFDRVVDDGPRFHLSDGRIERPISSALAGAGTLISSQRGDEGLPWGKGRDVERDDSNGTLTAEASVDPITGRHDPTTRAEASSSADILARQAAHELDVYGKRGLALVWGEGARVRDAEQREYIDCIGGHGALALGHRHPAQVAALRDQADQIWFVPGSFGSPTRADFLDRLHSVLPATLNQTFLSNSGTEAVETAMKIARAHTGRSDFVAAIRGFHGRTLGALALTFEPHYRKPFEPLFQGVRRVPFNRVEALAEAIDEGAAAVVLEPVQGEGGVHEADPNFLQAAREGCDRTGALLVFDEVQTGFGRTGSMFAFERHGIVPDVLCLAKSIAGGLPLGATVVREGITLPSGTHGSTFGGNPIATAVAAATLEVLIDSDLVAQANVKGQRFADQLRAAGPEVVREVRQIGLMIGVQLRGRVRPYLSLLQERGVLALSAGASVLRLLPPLVITEEEIDEVARLVAEVLNTPVEVGGSNE